MKCKKKIKKNATPQLPLQSLKYFNLKKTLKKLGEQPQSRQTTDYISSHISRCDHPHSVKSHLKLEQLVFVNGFNLYIHFRVQVDMVLSSQGQALRNYTHRDTQTCLEIRAPELPKLGR